MREEEKREKMSHRKQLWLEMNQGRQQNKRIERERNDVEEKTEKKIRRRNVDPGERERDGLCMVTVCIRSPLTTGTIS